MAKNNRKEQHEYFIGGQVIVQPLTQTELSILYNDVDPKTFKGWIEPILSKLGTKRGNYYSIRQVRLIFESLDPPELFVPVSG